MSNALARDWQNDYADLVSGLKAQLKHLKDDEARSQALADMQQVLDRLRRSRNPG